MSLMHHYEQAVDAGEIKDDPLQRVVVGDFDRLAEDLTHAKSLIFKKRRLVKGLYIHGSVGVGKTFLMDLFYKNIPVSKKLRLHFHHFMQQIDAQLRALQGRKDPLKKIASDLAKKYRLLCLDEFLVYDIADAMILAQLLKELFAHHVVLVATSNTEPDNLYLKGLQRARFLPAIELIKEHCDVIAVGVRNDYRMCREQALKAYFFPLNQTNQHAMEQQFKELSPEAKGNAVVDVQKRVIPCLKLGEKEVWFDFNDICNIPRSQLDYLEIANRFDTVFVSNIPTLTSSDTVKAILFIHFIDVMYDERIRLILSSQVSVDEIYPLGALHNEFQRTVSRLHEMQSVDYLYSVCYN